MRSSLMASTTSFAHLLGLGAPKAGKKAANEDDPDKDEHREDAKGTKSKAEDDEKPDDQGEDESDEDYKERKKREQDDAKGKKAKSKSKAEGKDEDEDDSTKKAARREERARCAAIFASPAAGVRPDLAAHFAFATDLDAEAAVAALEVGAQGQTAPRRASLADRMAGETNPNVGTGDGAPAALKPHQRLAAAHAKATGQKL